MPSFVPSPGMLARSALILLGLAAIGAVLMAWSGFYSVAASRGHWPGFELFLDFGMRSSVRTHAWGIEVPQLDDENRVRRGAAHFHLGCAPCHGAPSTPPMLATRSMLPEPSNLKVLAPTWKPNELFWIVKNGLKYTGMPAWPTQRRDDEVWDMVAFLLRLPAMTPERYRSLAGLDRVPQQPLHANRPGEGPDRQRTLVEACTRCHGREGRARDTTAFPRLDLQTEGWLLAQMQAYASGRRPSGVMQTATTGLTTPDMTWLARHFASAGGQPAGAVVPPSDPAGEAIFLRGAPEHGVPACVACHAADAAARDRAYPALLGQHAGHIERQLALYRDGKRRTTDEAQLMSTIAGRMTDEQVHAVAAYLSSQPAAVTGR